MSTKTKPSSLTAADLENFAKLKIPPDLLALAEVGRVDDGEAGDKFGIVLPADCYFDRAGIIFPYFLHSNGKRKRVTARVRRDKFELDEKGRPANKYISARGDRRHLYLPPGYESLLDSRIPRVFVEAEKSVLSVAAWSQRTGRKLLPLGCGGCWGWKGRIGLRELPDGEREEEKGPLAEVAFACAGGDAYILFDSNCATNPKVQAARAALAAQLKSQGARVIMREVPATEGINGPDDFIALRGDEEFARLLDTGITAGEFFDTYQEFMDAKPAEFAIEGFLQCEAGTLIAGLAEHFKTWLMLSLCKALLDERIEKLWGVFPVRIHSKRCIYLIPESSRGAFKRRLLLMGLLPFVQDGRLLIRTLTKEGPFPKLQDARLLSFVPGAHTFLDTAVRFMSGDESKAGDVNAGFAADVFALQKAGAASVVAAVHSPKDFEGKDFMTLENMVRGSGDVGALAATAWGLRTLPGDIIHIESLKHRDFEGSQPFQLLARPCIDNIGNLDIWKMPGNCGLLADEMPSRNRGNTGRAGASEDARDARALKVEKVREWLAQNPDLTDKQIAAEFAKIGIKVAPGSVRRYKSELEP
ncbi:MAG: AAA family ATPase [Candidatus Acidiferrales bacterium]